MHHRFRVAAAALLLAAAELPAAELPAVRDDYAAARAQAKDRHVPLIVEAWAPW